MTSVISTEAARNKDAELVIPRTQTLDTANIPALGGLSSNGVGMAKH